MMPFFGSSSTSENKKISDPTKAMDKGQLMAALKERMNYTDPLPDEPHFATSDETIVRYLKSSEWKLKEAEKALLSTLEYRRQTRPLRLDCKWCHERPGYHSMRQVGHDESGRPVIYANFAQAATHKNSVEDVVAHVTYLIESAKATMDVGVTTWVFVIDCTGMTLNACNPKLGFGMSNILSNHYPERLGLVICVNHNAMFHGVWKALKKVVSPGTTAKVRLVRSVSKVQQVFSTFFSDELSNWLVNEIELNKQRPLPKSQLEFWRAPPSTAFSALNGTQPHDPRGCPTYIRDYVLPFQRLQDTQKPSTSPFAFWRGAARAGGSVGESSSGCSKGACSDEGAIVPRHRPHPNIVDSLFGEVRVVSTSAQEQAERLEAMSGLDASEDTPAHSESSDNGTVVGITGANSDAQLLDDEDETEEGECYEDFHRRVDNYIQEKKMTGDQ
ncbi:hypothetical protein EGW08_012041 [Elysia chlorotica]|uniref:CRAL-TRIO domain-containing protein n=1 Tax=Elysia chlorotica TaxID=188477 RepID=A0A3S1BBG2_ELYCH|nr:hypothetical protein EGW08_012041 [Elysia chlorotica]